MHRCPPGPRRSLLTRDAQDSQAPGACTVSVHPLLGPHVRLQEEPERHVWQAEVGTAAQPWLGDYQVNRCGRPAGGCLLRDGAGRGSGDPWRGIRGPRHPLRAGPAAGRSDRRRCRRVERDRRASPTSRSRHTMRADTHDGPARSCMRRTMRRATCARHVDPPGSAPAPRGGRRGPETDRQRWCSVRSGVHRPGRRAHRRRATSHLCWPRSRCPVPSARNMLPTACTQRCWMPVSSPSWPIRTSRPAARGSCRCRWVSAGYALTVPPAMPTTATRG